MSLLDVPVNALSKEKNPFAFFIELAKINPIPFAIKSFQSKLPNSGENSWFQNVPSYTIADDKLSFTIDVNVVNDGNVDNDGLYTPNAEGEWKNKLYVFREELAKLLKDEYKEACLNLHAKWDKPEFNPYYSKTWFKGSIEDLLQCIHTIELIDEVLDEYKRELIRPYKALIKEMYRNFRKFVPNQNSYILLSEILDDSAEEAFKGDNLNVNVANSLFEHRDEYKLYFFDITNRPEALKSFTTFVRTNDFTQINSPIKFNYKNIGAAYYAIKRSLNFLITN